MQKGVDCLGPEIHENDCDEGHCPVDGGLSQWTNWGECNRACGPEGTRKRLRFCTEPFPLHGGKQCNGKMEETGPCPELPPCPSKSLSVTKGDRMGSFDIPIVHCLFSEWGEWSPCSMSCGDGPGAGTRTRQRHIAIQAQHGGLKCKGSLSESAACVHCTQKDMPKVKLDKCIPMCPSKVP